MSKLPVIIVIVFAISFLLSYVASENQKQYRMSNFNPSEKKDALIYPFYELWVYIGGVIVAILVVSTLVYRIKRSNSI